MNYEDYILISVDDHIVEPPHMFDGRLPKKYQDKAPKYSLRDDGASIWTYEGHELETFAVNAVVGRPPAEWGFEPQSFDDLRAGCYDVHARVKDMSANGEWASMNFSTFVQFPGTLFALFAHRDPEQATAMIRAYNDWHVDEWCAAYPDRFIPLGLVPVHDPDACVAEIERLAGKGCHAISMMGEPYPFPSYYTDHWNGVFSACQDFDTKICLHLGAGASVHNMVGMIDDSPPLPPPEPFRGGLRWVGIGVNSGGGLPPAIAADLLNSHLFERFPRLKVALSEGGIGWIPYFLEVADHRLKHHGPWTGMDFGGRLPSEIFKEHVFGCFIEDRAGMLCAEDLLNPDMIGWESDYPHSDGIWPDAPEKLSKIFSGLPDDLVHKVTHQNAAKFFGFDPFINRKPDKCTVKALRAEVADWDISIESAFKHRVPGTMVGQFMHAQTADAPPPLTSISQD
jgi:predicted TIM-barrel fold metal-dependent hydrolase